MIHDIGKRCIIPLETFPCSITWECNRYLKQMNISNRYEFSPGYLQIKNLIRRVSKLTHNMKILDLFRFDFKLILLTTEFNLSVTPSSRPKMISPKIRTLKSLTITFSFYKARTVVYASSDIFYIKISLNLFFRFTVENE